METSPPETIATGLSLPMRRLSKPLANLSLKPIQADPTFSRDVEKITALKVFMLLVIKLSRTPTVNM